MNSSVAPGRTTLPVILREAFSMVVGGSLWWYTGGLARTTAALRTFMRSLQDRTGFLLSVRNLFTPMYQDYTPSGRIISFFFRLTFLAADVVVMTVGAAVAASLFLLYVLLPPFVLANILHQLRIIQLL